MSDDHLDGHAYMLQMANEISRLRADNERLTRERDEARAGSKDSLLHFEALKADYEAAERKVERLRKALRSLLDVFERCETGFPPYLGIRFAVRDNANAALAETETKNVVD